MIQFLRLVLYHSTFPVTEMLQVKERILDLKYRGVPFSERPLANEIDLELVFFSNNYFCIYTFKSFNLAANFNTSFSSAGPGW